MSKKKSGFFSWIFGIKLLKNNFNSTRDIIKRSRPSYDESRMDDFEDVLENLNLKTEDDKISHLINIYSNLKLSFFITSIMSLILFFVLFIPSLINMSYLSLISSFLIILSISLMSVIYSVRCYQVRQRRLLPLSEWRRNKKEWFPKKINKDSLIIKKSSKK
jgi:hypothetical protein